MEKEKVNSKLELVFCVVRYGQIIGVYASYDDAAQVQKLSIAKGQICDMVPKPVIYPQI